MTAERSPSPAIKTAGTQRFCRRYAAPPSASTIGRAAADFTGACPIRESTLTRMICGMISSQSVKSRLAAMQAAKYRQLPCSSRASVRPLELFFFCFRVLASLSFEDRPRAELGTPIPPLWPRTIFLELLYRTCSGMSTVIMRCRSDHSCRAMLWLPRTRRAGSFPQTGCPAPRFSEAP